VRRLVLGVLLATFTGSAQALTPQELSDLSQPRVALVSVRDGRGDQIGTGSGFLISSGGRLVTNYHVVDGAASIVVVFPSGREARVTGVWAHDRALDLAVLQLEPGSYEAFTLASEQAIGGENVALVGYPRGLGPAVTTGIVSSLQREGLKDERLSEELPGWALRITAPSEPGSSGSPILRNNGEVVGVLVGDTSMFRGIFFGIPVAKLRGLLGKASPEPQELTSVTGGRSVSKNLAISAAFFVGLVLLWVVGSRLQRRGQKHAGARR
jgi:S1-C subfamily serine protease